MKSQHLLPVLTAAVGFAFAWALKPGTPAPATQPAPGTEAAADKPSRPAPAPRRTAGITERRPEEVKANDFPLVEQASHGPKSRTEAKMLRLSEALGLSVEQEGQIIAAVEQSKTTDSSMPTFQDIARRGKDLEAGLATILTPEQLAKFDELRSRERDNRIEARAQRVLAQTIEEVDLSPGQRDEVLARLRQYSKAEVQAIPAAATLLLNSSLLPTEATNPTLDGLLTFARMGEEPVAPDNPMEAHQRVLLRQREELEERLRCYDGILTAGQMSQIHAAVAEQRAILDDLRRPTKPRPEPATPE